MTCCPLFILIHIRWYNKRGLLHDEGHEMCAKYPKKEERRRNFFPSTEVLALNFPFASSIEEKFFFSRPFHSAFIFLPLDLQSSLDLTNVPI